MGMAVDFIIFHSTYIQRGCRPLKLQPVS
jgi:hypothetical protein